MRAVVGWRWFCGAVVLTAPLAAQEAAPPTSVESLGCLGCHETVTPGIVADWRRSRHATVTPGAALTKPELQRRVSAAVVPAADQKVVVGCFECHGRRTAQHPDSFDHFGTPIHSVVSPPDCQTCHPTEVEQYSGSKKAHAVGNLLNNPVYHGLLETTTAARPWTGLELGAGTSSPATQAATCLACHGTEVKVTGQRTVASEVGDVVVPTLSNWPNQGVGRLNPDGSRGACTPCHARHAFSIAVARSPETCSQCHLEPDVPAWEVYRESKHGNLYHAAKSSWTMDSVPWQVGADFQAPTCATCHSSLLTTPEGQVVAERSHDFGSRLWVRLFGLPYAHPQPLSGATEGLRNKDGLPLPTAFDGTPAATGLLPAAAQQERRERLTRVCSTCHSQSWATGHWAALDHAVAETNQATLTATRLLQTAWERNLLSPGNPFDEPLERRWVRQWMFYGNSIRYAAAMSGPDYAAFKNGWWSLNENLGEMHEWVTSRLR